MSKRNWGQAFSRAAGSVAGAALNRYANSGTRNVNVTHTYAGGGPAGGVKFSRERHRVGRRGRRNRAKLGDVFRQMESVKARWQLTSPTLTGPGKVPIGYGYDSITLPDNYKVLPIHLMSITQNPYNFIGNTLANKGSFAHGMYKVVRDSSNGKLGLQSFVSNTQVGYNNFDANGHWQREKGIFKFDEFCIRPKMFHKWTKVSMNLYGAKYIPLTYNIRFYQFPKEFDPFQEAPNSGHNIPEFSEFARFVEDISRPLLLNPINDPATKNESRGKCRLLRSFKIDIAPLSYTNAASETTAAVHVGNVRQFTTFFRHDRWRNYDWSEKDSSTTVDNNWSDLGWDVVTNEVPVTEVSWGSRIFMVVTCTTGSAKDLPQLGTYIGNPVQLSEIPDDFGTYDVVVRQEFMVPGP